MLQKFTQQTHLADLSLNYAIGELEKYEKALIFLFARAVFIEDVLVLVPLSQRKTPKRCLSYGREI